MAVVLITILAFLVLVGWSLLRISNYMREMDRRHQQQLARKLAEFHEEIKKRKITLEEETPQGQGGRVINLAVLISGGGRTLQNIIDHIEAGKLSARVVVVISSNPDAYGLVRAQEHGIDNFCVDRKKYSLDEFNRKINEILARYDVDLICLAGFMHLFKYDKKYEGKIMNIHPALIPAFCGKGFYGERVHKAVLESGVKVTGCTVHFVDEQYDHGPIILQETVPVLDDDTVETLAARVFEKECQLYPRAIQLFAEGRLKVEGRRVKILERTEV